MTIASWWRRHEGAAPAPAPASPAAPGSVSGPFPAHGEPFPNGLGGVRSDGRGGTLFEAQAVRDATDRMRMALARAQRDGVPEVTAAGDLPAGIHAATWGELQTRLAPAGNARRAQLTSELRTALDLLARGGVEQVVVGGSYVGSKVAPGDVDVAWVPRADGAWVDMAALQRPMAESASNVHVYLASQMVSNAPALPGGVPGENYLEFFQHTRDGAARGALLLSTQPVPVAPAEAVADRATGWSRVARALVGALR